MAKGNKRSFVFFEDWWEVIESLPSIQQRHDALVAIIEYALHGKVPADPFIAFGTARMRKEIDESKTRWHQTCEKRREAGKKGAATTNSKRWGNSQQESANDDNSQQMSANDDTSRQMSATVSNSQQPSSKSADNDIKYEYKDKINNINNNINVIASARVREEFFDAFFSDERRAEIEQLCIARGFDGIDDFKRLARGVLAEWAVTGKTHTSKQDAYRHLIDHCSKQKQAELRAARQTTPLTTPNPHANPRPNNPRPSRQERDTTIAQAILDQFNSDD